MKKVIVDVRSPDEFQSGHICGARLIPAAQLQERLAELEPEDEVVVYCNKGGPGTRSFQAAELLETRGFKHARALEGGLQALGGRVCRH